MIFLTSKNNPHAAWYFRLIPRGELDKWKAAGWGVHQDGPEDHDDVLVSYMGIPDKAPPKPKETE